MMTLKKTKKHKSVFLCAANVAERRGKRVLDEARTPEMCNFCLSSRCVTHRISQLRSKVLSSLNLRLVQPCIRLKRQLVNRKYKGKRVRFKWKTSRLCTTERHKSLYQNLRSLFTFKLFLTCEKYVFSTISVIIIRTTLSIYTVFKSFSTLKVFF